MNSHLVLEMNCFAMMNIFSFITDDCSPSVLSAVFMIHVAHANFVICPVMPWPATILKVHIFYIVS